MANRFRCPYDYEKKVSNATFDVEDLFELATVTFAVEISLAVARKDTSAIQINNKQDLYQVLTNREMLDQILEQGLDYVLYDKETFNVEAINKTRNDIMDSYNNGKLSSEHHTNLTNKISNTYQKIFKKRIESITEHNPKAISNLKNNIEDAYSDRKITELDYNLLNGKISRMLDKK